MREVDSEYEEAKRPVRHIIVIYLILRIDMTAWSTMGRVMFMSMPMTMGSLEVNSMVSITTIAGEIILAPNSDDRGREEVNGH